MFQVIFCSGAQIYDAAVAGANAGYNRTTDEHGKYEELLAKHYEQLLEDVEDEAVRRNVKRTTGNSWRKASLPLALALVHTHKGGVICEEHARVFLTTSPASVFDIPMSNWKEMKKQSTVLLIK